MNAASDTIEVRVPGRVNLIGDHTDYTGGLAMPMAIDRWTVLTVRHSDDEVDLVSAEQSGRVRVSLTGDASPDASMPAWGRYVAAVVAEMHAAVDDGLIRGPLRAMRGELRSSIPVGAGLSSSAALGVAVALGLGVRVSERSTGPADAPTGLITPVDLARLAQRAENRATGVPTGIMDQLCIVSARAGHATLIDCASLHVEQVPVPDAARVAVVFVAHRTLDGSPYADRVAQCAAAEAVIGSLASAQPGAERALADPLLRRRARHVITENARVREFAAAFTAGDLATAGAVMDASHRSLRDDYEVSTAAMDACVADLRARTGVHGARLTGGGFGGCVVALCDPGVDIPGAWWVTPVDGAH